MSAPTRQGPPRRKVPGLTAPAYCLRLTESGRWLIVDNGTAEAMAVQAEQRAAFVHQLHRSNGRDPDDHVTEFLAVPRDEAVALLAIRPTDA